MEYKESSSLQRESKLLGENDSQLVSEEEIQQFEFNINSAIEALSSSDVPQSISFLYPVISMIESNEFVSSLLNDTKITVFLCNLVCASTISNVVPPLFLLSKSISENNDENEKQIITQCSSTRILNQIVNLLSMIDKSTEIAMPAYEILLAIISEDINSHKPFLEMGGIDMLMKNIEEYEEKYIRDNIGLIIYNLIDPSNICAIGSLESETKTIVDDVAIQKIVHIFSILLGSRVYNTAFIILSRIIEIKRNKENPLSIIFSQLFNSLIEDGTFNLVFDSGVVLSSLTDEIEKLYIAYTSVSSYEEPLDVKNKILAVKNGINVISMLVNEMPDEIVKYHFCLDEMISISLKCSSPCKSVCKISHLAMDCIDSFVRKSYNCCSAVFERSFIYDVLEMWEVLSIKAKSSFISILLDLFCLLPAGSLDCIDDEIWEYIFDFVDVENTRMNEKVAHTIKNITDRGYMFIKFEPYLEIIEELGEESEFFSILHDIIVDHIEEEED